MIRIQNTPVTPQQLAALPLRHVERAIVDALAESPTTFLFSSYRSFLYEVMLRGRIVNSAHALNGSGVAFAVDRKSRCNPAFWKRTEEGGFQLLPNVAPSAAIRDIFLNGRMYAFECATAIVIVYYKSVLDTYKPEAFDQFFANLLLYHWHYDRDLRLQVVKTTDFIPGDVVYFKNPEVSPEEPQWQGENTVFLGNGLYYGHGIGIISSQNIINHLNSRRFPGATISAFRMNETTRPDFNYLAQFANIPSEPGMRVDAPDAESGWGSRFIHSRIGFETSLRI